MCPITLDQLAAAVGAALASGPTIHAVCTDTRDLKPGSLFVPLRGDSFDAHDFLPQAAAGGCVAALVDRDVPPVPGLTLLRVDDARRAMGRLATFVRRRFKGAVIAVAGSNGKTGTKHLIHAALSSTLRGTMSPKSFNNDVGVPVTLFAAGEDDDFVVLEVGTNHPGELANLSQIAEPDVAVITNVGAEHLEFFQDIHGVRREEASVIAGLRPDGLCVVNGDDPDLLPLVTGHAGPLITFGWDELNHVRPTHVVCTSHGTTFDWYDDLAGSLGPFFVPQLGRHTALNAMAAVLVGNHMGVGLDKVREGLAGEHGPDMRLRLDPAGPVTILNDAYNANPSSMAAALETVRDLTTPGRKIAVLGDMLEMGDAAAAGHADVGTLAAASHLDALVCVGPLSAGLAAAATAAGLSNVSHVPTTADAATAVPPMLRPGDLVLLKASRGMRLERVATAIHGTFG
jgi:UDP-N-acetylmuramoyl-tripeptide--D-alanyl-D-alanine ligase